MISNCIMFMLNGRAVAFPFASPGPHDDTIERFKREGFDPKVRQIVFVNAMGEPITVLGFKGAYLLEATP